MLVGAMPSTCFEACFYLLLITVLVRVTASLWVVGLRYTPSVECCEYRRRARHPPPSRKVRVHHEYVAEVLPISVCDNYQREEKNCRALLVENDSVHHGSALFSFFFFVIVFPRGGCSPSSRGVMFPGGCFCCFCFCYTVDVAVPWCRQQVLCTSPVLSRTELDPNSTTYPAGVHAQRNTILNYRFYNA